MTCKTMFCVVGVAAMALGIMSLMSNNNEMKIKMPNCITKMMNNN